MSIAGRKSRPLQPSWKRRARKECNENLGDLLGEKPLVASKRHVACTARKNSAVWEWHGRRCLRSAVMLPRRIAALDEEQAGATGNLDVCPIGAGKRSKR